MRGYRAEDAADLVHVEECRAIKKSERAILVITGDGDEVWVPRSIIHDDSDVWDPDDIDGCGPGNLVVPGWWARDRRLA